MEGFNKLSEKPPLSKSKGAVRNLTNTFLKFKHKEEIDLRPTGTFLMKSDN